MEVAKQGLFFVQKRGAVVSQLVPKLKESVPPPLGGVGGGVVGGGRGGRGRVERFSRRFIKALLSLSGESRGW